MKNFKQVLQKILPRSAYVFVGNFYNKFLKTKSLREKVALDLFPGPKGPQYAYGLYWAAKEAKALGIEEMCAIEFGVATGTGLISMETTAKEIEKEVGIKINVFGFDMKGLPAPKDFKDLPYVWREGFYQMDEEVLRSKLNKAELVIGDVKDTVPEFLNNSKKGVIGFVSIDVDYYSSTKDALNIFAGDFNRYLPRTYIYFDDVVSKDETIYCDRVGELLAIKEFNEENKHREVGIHKIEHLSYRRKNKMVWNEKMYVLHMFKHPGYCSYVLEDKNRQYGSEREA